MVRSTGDYEYVARVREAAKNSAVEFLLEADRHTVREVLAEANLFRRVVGSLTAEATQRLDGAEGPTSLVYSVKDPFEDQQVRARENIVSAPSRSGACCTWPVWSPAEHDARRRRAAWTPRGGGAQGGKSTANGSV